MIPAEGEEDAYAERLTEMVDALPNCFFVHNGSLFVGDLVTPDLVDNDEAEPEETKPPENEAKT